MEQWWATAKAGGTEATMQFIGTKEQVPTGEQTWQQPLQFLTALGLDLQKVSEEGQADGAGMLAMRTEGATTSQHLFRGWGECVG